MVYMFGGATVINISPFPSLNQDSSPFSLSDPVDFNFAHWLQIASGWAAAPMFFCFSLLGDIKGFLKSGGVT